MTHCISPSEYYNDYYNNDSFNKINLQLHASSKVSNPYSFSIKSNTSFSGDVQSLLPETATLLLEITNDGGGPFIDTFTVPSGCKVVKTHIVDRAGREINLVHQSNGMIWNSADDGVGNNTTYIGVTPGKTYSLIFYAEDTDYAWARIWYSSEINTHTPDVTDY